MFALLMVFIFAALLLWLVLEVSCRYPRSRFASERGSVGSNRTIDLATRIGNIEGFLGLSPLTAAPTGTPMPFFGNIEVESADGAIGIKIGTAVITKGSAAALTLVAPTAGADDGDILRIQSTTAYAHVITVTGLENSATTITLGGLIGDQVTLQAYGGVWYVIAEKNVQVQ